MESGQTGMTGKMPKIVYVIGDIHGDFGALNTFINKQIRQNKSLRAIAADWRARGEDLEAIILQCGDFAFYWPGCNNDRAIQNEISFLKSGLVTIYWCAGNHEDHDRLDSLFSENSPACSSNIAEVGKGIYFCRFGATLNLAAETTVLFAGGAESTDKSERVAHLSWWPQEGVSNADLDRLNDVSRVDIVISHTAPAAFNLDSQMAKQWWNTSYHLEEASRYMLDEVLEKYHPREWYFGHFHKSMHGRCDGCDWECLNCLGSSGKTWEKLYFPT